MNNTARARQPLWLLALLTLLLAAPRLAAETTVFFPLNEGSGTTFTDSISGLTGTLGLAPQNPDTDSPAVQEQSPSGAAGDRSILTQGNGFLIGDDRDTKALDLTNGPITMETWINIDPNFGRQNEGFGSYGNSYKLGLKGGELVWTLLGVRDITNSAGGIFPVGEWTHVAAAWDPGVGVTFYVNGVANFVESTHLARPVLHNYLSVGSEGTGNSVVAMFDRFRIHNALLTPEQLDNAAATAKPVYEDTVVSYQFNETALPLQNSAATSIPLRSSVELLPSLTGPTWTSNSPTGAANDFALQYDGTKRALIPDPNDVISLSPEHRDYTLEAWVNLPVGFTPAARMIVFTYEGDPGFSLSINNNRTVHTTTFGLADTTSSALVPNDGQWHHIAVVHQDGVELRFYVDGTLRDTRPYTRGPGVRSNPTAAIGSALGGGNPFTGMIDRVRFSNHALTAEELDFPAVPGFPRILTEPAGLISSVGSNVVLSATAAGQQPLSLQWFFSPTGVASNAVSVANANSATLNLNNITAANAGVYFLTVSNAVGQASTSPIQLQVATQTNFLTRLWALAPGDRDYLTAGAGSGQTDNLERGLAYNPATSHLLIVARETSPVLKGVYILDAATGAHIGELNATGIDGGTFVLSRIGVADDGAIYAANFGTFSDTNPLKIYRWANETAEPTLAFSGNPATGLANQQWGKNLDVRGSGANTQILMDTRTTYVGIFTTTDGLNFTPRMVQTDAPADAFSLGIQFADTTGNAFVGKSANNALYELTFDLTSNTATVVRAYHTFPANFANFGIDFERGLLAGVDVIAGPDNLHIYDVSPATGNIPALLDVEPFATDTANNTYGGNTVFGGGRVFSLNTNNGLIAWQLPSTDGAPELGVQLNGANVVITWPATAEGFTLQATSSLSSPNWQPVAAQNQGGQFTATVPTTERMQFFRLTK